MTSLGTSMVVSVLKITRVVYVVVLFAGGTKGMSMEVLLSIGADVTK